MNCQEQQSTLSSFELEIIMKILQRHTPQADSLIPVLHEVQKKLNYLPESAIHEIAAYLKISPSKVYGVATFYSLFATKPKGQNIIRVCGSAPCYVVGSGNLLKTLESILGISKSGETTADGKFTLEYTSCLGVCGVAPAMMINDQVYGNLTEEKLQEILKQFR